MNIYAKFHQNLLTMYGDNASREIGVNGRTDGRTARKHDIRYFPPATVGGGITNYDHHRPPLPSSSSLDWH